MSGTAPLGASARAPLEEKVAVDRAAAWMTNLLRVGLGVALAVLASALAVLLVQDPSGTWSRATGARVLEGYLGLDGFLAGLARGTPEAILTIGVLVLLATPVIRVLTGLYFFRRARDRPMTWIAALVLTLLLAGIFLIGPVVR